MIKAAPIFLFAFLSLNIVAFATETEPPAIYGDLTIYMVDETAGEFLGDIRVSLTCISTGNQYTIVLNALNFLLEIPVTETLRANTTYRVEIMFSEPLSYVVVDRLSNDPVERLHMTASGYVARWELRNPYMESFTPVDPPSPTTTDIQDDDIYVEAAILFENFLEAVAHINDNPAFINTLLPHRPHLGVQYQRFARFTSGTDEEWLAKTSLERFIWHETYLRPLYQLTLGEFNAFFGSESIFLDNIRSPLQNLTNEGDGSEADAFSALMLWQYNFIINTGTVFNFVTRVSHRDSDGRVGVLPLPPTPDNYSNDDDYLELTVEDSEEIYEAIVEAEVIVPYVPAERGIWDDVLDRLRAHWFSIILLFIVGGGLVCVIVYKKQNEIKDPESS